MDDIVAEDLRRLYLKRPVLIPALYVAITVALVGLGWRDLAGGAGGGQAAFWGIAAAASLYLGFAAPQVAYRRWSAAIRRENIAGFVDESGVQVENLGRVLPWSSFRAAKTSDVAAILYVSKTDGLPLHRRFLASEADWRQAIQVVGSRIR